MTYFRLNGSAGIVMFDPDNYPITIAEMPSVQRELDEVLCEDEKSRLIDWLAMNPTIGDIIPGTNGIRKCRWTCRNQGKRGGLRIIYYFRDLNMPVVILAVYQKREKLNLTMREKKMMAKLVDELVEVYGVRLRSAVSRAAG